MRSLRKHRLAVVTVVYWLLLMYMMAALFFWFIELNAQNKLMTSFRLSQLKKDDPAYLFKRENVEETEQLKTAQYIGEGSAFLAVILVGALFVFRSTRRQIRLSHQQQNFMMAITHELKTPVAVTRLNLETLQKRKLEPDQQQKLISNTLQEANRLDTLCNNILLASQLDAGAYLPVKEDINLSGLVKGCIKDSSMRYPQRKIEEAIQEDIYLNGDKLLLQMLANNLIENALKYSPRDSSIRISLHGAGKEILFKVSDEGIGVADAEKKKVFEKFYRTGDENTRKAKGTGLGLYLCRKIAAGHNGHISMIDNRPKGSIFTVIFHV